MATAALDVMGGTTSAGSVSTDILTGLAGSGGMKAPCAVATTANVALSGLSALDGYTPSAGNRILVWQQTDATQNGIWNASAGAWSRAIDCDGKSDLMNGTQVAVVNGTTYAGVTFMVSSADPITVGVSALTFTASSFAGSNYVAKAGGTMTGNLTAPNLLATSNILAGGVVGILSKSIFWSDVDGNLMMTDSAGTAFGLLKFGGATTSYPALKRSSAALQVRLGDDSAYGNLTGAIIEAKTSIKFPDGTTQTSAATGGGSTDILATNSIGISTKSILTSAVDGNLRVSNAAGTGFGLLQFGGVSSSFPALKRNTTQIDARLADDSAYANITGAILEAKTSVKFADGTTQTTAAIGGSTTYQAVGTYAILAKVGIPVAGTSYAGSALFTESSSSPAGTWKCMGTTDPNGGGNTNALYLRTA